MVGDEGFSDPPLEPNPETAAQVEAFEGPIRYGDDGVSHVLAVPITVPAKGGTKTIDRIVFRRPTGGDILEVGNPVIFDPGRAQITHDMQRMPLMIFRLSGVQPPVLAKMDPRDLVDCMWAITPFFIPRM